MKRPDAKVYHLTAKKSQTAEQLIRSNLSAIDSKKVILSGGAWLNAQRVQSLNAPINIGDTLKIYTCPTQGYTYMFPDSFIINETADWVVVYKEPLITVAMDRSNMFFNLMAGLNEYYGYGDLATGVQPITRLDYRVAGLCLFSKRKSAERRLFSQMQQRRIKKRYKAIVPINTAIYSRLDIKNHLNHKRKAYEDPSGKFAQTRFIYDQDYDQGRSYHAITKTGRRHQIRCHAAQFIAPLINDELYSRSYNDRHQPIGLIATYLKFIWNGQIIRISLPNDFLNKSLTDLTV